jgi:hypothetical protein
VQQFAFELQGASLVPQVVDEPQNPFWHVRPLQHSVLVPQAIPEVLQGGGGTAQVPLVHASPEQHSEFAVHCTPEALQRARQAPPLHQ